MKILKLIGFMLLTANLVMAQDNYSAPHGTIAKKKMTSIGAQAGQGGNSSGECTFIGYRAGANSNTWHNTFVGAGAGETSTGAGNLAFGAWALRNSGAGKNNIAIGSNAGQNATGSYNINVGANAGENGNAGIGNTYIGYAAGVNNSGDNNLFLGSWAGYNLSSGVSNKLYIDNLGNPESFNDYTTVSDVNTPLIYGDFTTHQVGIGTNDVGTYALAVKGHIVAEEVTINLYDANNGGWPDYVFAEDYELMPLNELETEIETLGHLPGVPSAEEVEENGHKVGQMDAILLEKVEELTLHLIEMNKAIKTLQESEKELRKENEVLKSELNKKDETLEVSPKDNIQPKK